MPRPVSDRNQLSINHPDLPAYLDPQLNCGLTADRVASSSNRELIWTCLEASHRFTATPARMTRRRNDRSYPRCPKCVKLVYHSPTIAGKWHPTKNGELVPSDVSYGSNRRVWWKCSDAECPVVGGHDWQDTVCHRTTGNRGCPACAGKVLTGENRLSSLYPEISNEWHPTKNGNTTLRELSYGSSEKVWWKCKNAECPDGGGYDWEATVNSRTNMGAGCPACAGKAVTGRNQLTLLYPALAKEWIRCLKCGLTGDEHSFGSNHRVSWRCSACRHIWNIGISDRTRPGISGGTGCPGCAGKEVTSDNWLAKHPPIAEMVLPELNDGLRAYNIHESSNKLLNLKCRNGHVFRRSPNYMIRKEDGILSYRSCRECRMLAFCDPEIAVEWHPLKNGDLIPDKVSYGSNQKVWWQCRNADCPVSGGHEWEATISSRTNPNRGVGCPACAAKVVTDRNRLASNHQTLVKEWVKCLDCDFTPDDHPQASNHRARWRCNFKKHTWSAIIASRSRGSGCPKCNPHRSRREIRIACELAYVFPMVSPDVNVSLHETDRRKLICDIYDPEHKLVIEYDGLPWHEGRAREDIEKVRQLELRGNRVLRLREVGLQQLPHNVHYIDCEIRDYENDESIKTIVDDVLRYIDREFNITNSRAESYLERGNLANAELAAALIANELERQLQMQF